MRGTYHFYTDDYKFDALWKDPTPIINAGCVNAVEINFSTNPQMPAAEVLYRIYKKRWLARYWQSKGVRIFVDLNVAEPFHDLNLLGVPTGWKAYATRGYTDRLPDILQQHSLACQRAATTDILFVVIGGGKTVKAECQAQGWVWVPEDAHIAEGREQAYGQS